MIKGRKPGAALDVGMGQGRNAVFLAQAGWIVTGFDPARKAVAVAIQSAKSSGVPLTTEITTSELFDFGENRWDLIVATYVTVREHAVKLQKALKPHGVLVVEGYHRQATKGRGVGNGVVFDTGELINLFADLRVVRYEEPLVIADFGKQTLRVVRYCGEKVE